MLQCEQKQIRQHRSYFGANFNGSSDVREPNKKAPSARQDYCVARTVRRVDARMNHE